MGTAVLGESLSVYSLPQTQDGVQRLLLVAWSVTLKRVLQGHEMMILECKNVTVVVQRVGCVCVYICRGG